ncbi:hypothetical protein F4803DRAFT_549949 [Xylaria telfairii]|nr:hypothetical protein F4803DRAFT_549949 [Xylaria telfairii]
MHLRNIPILLLVGVSSLGGSSLALPFIWKRTPAAEALAARPTYSVIPIDGSGGQGGDADTTLTVTVTPAPTTVVESSPPVTETVTVSGKPATRTISVIDIQPTTEFVTTISHTNEHISYFNIDTYHLDIQHPIDDPRTTIFDDFKSILPHFHRIGNRAAISYNVNSNLELGYF